MAPIIIGTEAYDRWRSGALGGITEAIEHGVVSELIGPVDGRTVLDVGCGDGALAVALARQGGIVTGLDADPVMVAAAIARGKDLAEFRVRIGKAEKLPYADGHFDVVCAVTLLCLVENPEAAFAELVRVLAPGGRLVVGELNRWSLWALRRRIKGWLGDPIWRRARFHDGAWLRAAAERHGLRAAALRGAVFYPPWGWAARAMAGFDADVGRLTTLGAAFVAMAADKPD